MYNFIKFVLNEGAEPKTLTQTPLPYDRKALGKSLSKASLDYHYGSLYKGYVDRYNAGEGDPNFNEAGAYLHDKYFTQFRAPQSSNAPTGNSLNFIQEHYKSFNDFKEEFAVEAMKIQGSGWVYLAKDGKIKNIANHQIKQDIVLIIDWWEHAWALDYKADKKLYLDNQWKIINWDIINQRV